MHVPDELKAQQKKLSKKFKLKVPLLKGRPLWQQVVVGLIALYIVVAILYGFIIYLFKPIDPATEVISGLVPYPAATVNGLGGFVSYHDYLADTNSIAHYYKVSQNVKFTGKDGRAKMNTIKSQVLEQLIQNRLVSELAGKDKVTVSSKDVNDEYNKIVSANGGQAKVAEVLKKYYLWNVGQFKQRIKEQLLRQDLQNKVTSDPNYDSVAKQKADSILTQLKGGADFATLAKQDSEDSSASQGGDLGWASKGKFVEPFQSAAFALQTPGQLSPVIKTQFGYQIIKLIERTPDQVHVADILIKTEDFDTWLSGQQSKASITKFISIKASSAGNTPSLSQ